MQTKTAIRILAIIFFFSSLFFGYLLFDIKNNRGDLNLVSEEAKNKPTELKIEEKAATSTEAEKEWEAGREARIKAADEIMAKMVSDASSTEWEATKEERIKEADELMQKQIENSDTAKWEAEKEARIKAADELMRKMLDEQK
ncbi:MAG: hypothetical protein Q7T50_01400 [Candidatus Magasanikbacteria bacterium]|nr:hypothetical protein [Candidatus Magasanikbacteria bacterium]